MTLPSELEKQCIIEDPVQCTQQGVVFIELVPPCSGHGVAGEDHVEAAFLVVPAVDKIEEQPWKLHALHEAVHPSNAYPYAIFALEQMLRLVHPYPLGVRAVEPEHEPHYGSVDYYAGIVPVLRREHWKVIR